MDFALPLYAVQRLADGTWLARTQMGDPLWPAVDVVAVLGAPTSAAPRPARNERSGVGLRSSFVTLMCGGDRDPVRDDLGMALDQPCSLHRPRPGLPFGSRA